MVQTKKQVTNQEIQQTTEIKPKRKFRDLRTDDPNMRVHCIPVGDHEIHCAQLSCWCHPLLEDGDDETVEIAIHNAKDCREARERIDNRQHGGWVNIGEEI